MRLWVISYNLVFKWVSPTKSVAVIGTLDGFNSTRIGDVAAVAVADAVIGKVDSSDGCVADTGIGTVAVAVAGADAVIGTFDSSDGCVADTDRFPRPDGIAEQRGRVLISSRQLQPWSIIHGGVVFIFIPRFGCPVQVLRCLFRDGW